MKQAVLRASHEFAPSRMRSDLAMLPRGASSQDGLASPSIRRNSWSVTAQPTGTVTFLFTDIEGSTRLLASLGSNRYGEALSMHRSLLRAAFERNGGYEVNTQGDSFFVAFAEAAQATRAALEMQKALASVEWPGDAEFSVRIGVHTGTAVAREGDYEGLAVHRAARIAAAAHGGQILLSQATADLMQDERIAGVTVLDLGLHPLKDLLEPQRLYQLAAEGLRSDFPAPKTLVTGPRFSVQLL
jgi:class 3 adenylate cyclase